MIPFLFPFSQGLLFPLVALDKIHSSKASLWAQVENSSKEWKKKLLDLPVVL